MFRSFRPRRAVRAVAWAAVATVLAATTAIARAQSAPRAAPASDGLAASDLTSLSLEELGNIVVTSVSRRDERLSRAAASIFVITGDDIRRSGATSLAEALRLAPNLAVARADTNQYAISARGFNNVLSNKLLVMIDGRSVFSPLFSGVFWEAQDTMLEDIERIEVISGPGATLWGANAVNGVINVITRSARSTPGTLASATVGARERIVAARQGGTLGDTGAWRLYAKNADRTGSSLASGRSTVDASRTSQVGFRADWDGSAGRFALHGDLLDARIDQVPRARDVRGANLVARWDRPLANGSSLALQAWYDRTERIQPAAVGPAFRDVADTVDIEARHDVPLGARHHLVWGGGHRHTSDRVDGSLLQTFVPADRTLRWTSVFAQDEIDLGDDLALTLGAKLEHNVYTGTEVLPSARIAWRPSERALWWGALSRAARAPSRLDREYFSPATASVIRGGPSFVSETSNVLEVGYRARPSANLSFSVTAFHHEHRRLRTLEPAAGGGQELRNGFEGRTTGIEGWANWQVTRGWRLTGGLTLQDVSLRLAPGRIDLAGSSSLGNDARYFGSLRSSWDLGSRHWLDVTVRRVAALPLPAVPGYTAVDARLAWQATPSTEWAVIVRNALDPAHPEWGVAPNRVEHERSLLLQLTWRH